MPTTPRRSRLPAARRGGQPANQNARKTGLYSQYIPAQDAEDLEELVRVSGLKEEIALVRLRIRDLLADGASPNDLVKAIELLNRLISTNHRLIHF